MHVALPGGRPLAPWLNRIAANLCINYLTAAARREQQFAEGEGPAAEPPAPRTDGAPEPLADLLSLEFRRALDASVQKLPPDQRIVFDLKVHEEMRYEEIADTLDISTGTVMSRLFRARQKLKVMMKDYI